MTSLEMSSIAPKKRDRVHPKDEMNDVHAQATSAKSAFGKGKAPTKTARPERRNTDVDFADFVPASKMPVLGELERREADAKAARHVEQAKPKAKGVLRAVAEKFGKKLESRR
jgi:hypothetical protein